MYNLFDKAAALALQFLQLKTQKKLRIYIIDQFNNRT